MMTLKTKMRRMIMMMRSIIMMMRTMIMMMISANHDFSWGRDQCGADDGDDNLNQKWQKIREIMLRMLMMMIKKR